jgi:predicted ABC-type transport system involved in lysophospholipase L1 biosynthesis ATPase subunit
MTGQPPAAELHDVTVELEARQDTARALSSVSLTVAAASSTAIVGRSGSGKSTLVSVMALLRRPTGGRVTVSGRSTAGLSDAQLARLRAAFVGTVFQSFHLDTAMTAAENVMLPWYFGGRAPRREARARAALLLDRLELGELASRRPAEMSGGQRQRVAIARALFPGPGLLIADEPTGNLDETTAELIADQIFSLPGLMGTAVVVVTHDPAIAARAERRLHLSGGELCEP